MKALELLEASPFRQRATTNRTIGFEFEIEADITKPIEDIMEEYTIEDFWFDYYKNTPERLKNLIEKFNLEPKYGFVETKEVRKKQEKENSLFFDLIRKSLDYVKKNYENKEKTNLLELLTLLITLNQYYENLIKYNENVYIDTVQQLLNSNKFLINYDNNYETFVEEEFSKNDLLKLVHHSYEEMSKKLHENVDENVKMKEYIYDSKGMIKHLTELPFKRFIEYFEDSDDFQNYINREYNNEIEEMSTENDKETMFNEMYSIIEKKMGITDWKVTEDGSVPEGCEVVTNTYTNIDQALKDLDKFLEIIRKDSRLSTSRKTGLHINIGTWDNVNDLDLLKLLLFIGESNILNKFDRQMNPNTSPILPSLKDVLEDGNEKDYQKIINQLNNEILQQFDKHSKFIDFSKLKAKGYLEIRGFGNENYEYKHEYIKKLIQYILRVLEIAENPEIAKEKYIKALSKYVSSDKEYKNRTNFLTKNENKALFDVIDNSDHMLMGEIKTKLATKSIEEIAKNNYNYYLAFFESLTEIFAEKQNISSLELRAYYKILRYFLQNTDLDKNTVHKIVQDIQNSDGVSNAFKNFIEKKV